MIETIKISDRTIVVKGIGKMFYQDGFPIPMAVNECRKKGLEVSYLHLAKELLNEWQPKTVVSKLTGEFQDSISGDERVDMSLIEKFCYAEYKDQCEMIFQYLFGYTSESAIKGENVVPDIF